MDEPKASIPNHSSLVHMGRKVTLAPSKILGPEPSPFPSLRGLSAQLRLDFVGYVQWMMTQHSASNNNRQGRAWVNSVTASGRHFLATISLPSFFESSPQTGAASAVNHRQGGLVVWRNSPFINTIKGTHADRARFPQECHLSLTALFRSPPFSLRASTSFGVP